MKPPHLYLGQVRTPRKIEALERLDHWKVLFFHTSRCSSHTALINLRLQQLHKVKRAIDTLPHGLVCAVPGIASDRWSAQLLAVIDYARVSEYSLH